MSTGPPTVHILFTSKEGMEGKRYKVYPILIWTDKWTLISILTPAIKEIKIALYLQDEPRNGDGAESFVMVLSIEEMGTEFRGIVLLCRPVIRDCSLFFHWQHKYATIMLFYKDCTSVPDTGCFIEWAQFFSHTISPG